MDMAFNGDPISLTGQGHYTWASDGSAGNLDVQNTGTHEAGHYSGLADLYNPGDFNWTVDLKTNNLRLFPFPGFQNGGQYVINSLNLPPMVNFEAPFVFYDLDKKNRNAELAIRVALTYLPPNLSNNGAVRDDIRYSWKLEEDLWIISIS